MKKILDFYAKVLVDVNLFSSLAQQLLVECSGFVLVIDMEYERLSPFCSFCKMINHTLFACRHYLQSYRFDQQVKSEQLQLKDNGGKCETTYGGG